MNSLARFSIPLAAAIALTAGTASAMDTAKPVRHLVYTFDVTLSTTSTVHDSGIGGDGDATGSANYRAGNTDQGTINVDVLQVQPDSGLVVQISEQARNNRSAVPTMCVVYGNSAVICDQSHGQLNEEESSLLRFLGRNFVNKSQLDAKNHWRYSASDAQSQETNDFTLGTATGDTLPITYQRVLKVQGVHGFNATTDGTLTYDEKMSVPVNIKEETITRRDTGMGNYDTVQQQMTLTLSTDSLAQAH